MLLWVACGVFCGTAAAQWPPLPIAEIEARASALEAAEQWDQAVEARRAIVARLRETPAEGDLEAALLHLVASLENDYDLAGQVDDVVGALNESADLAARRGDSAARIELLHRSARVRFEGNDAVQQLVALTESADQTLRAAALLALADLYLEQTAHVEHALARWDELLRVLEYERPQRPALRAQALAGRARALERLERYDDAFAAHQAAALGYDAIGESAIAADQWLAAARLSPHPQILAQLRYLSREVLTGDDRFRVLADLLKLKAEYLWRDHEAETDARLLREVAWTAADGYKLMSAWQDIHVSWIDADSACSTAELDTLREARAELDRKPPAADAAEWSEQVRPWREHVDRRIEELLQTTPGGAEFAACALEMALIEGIGERRGAILEAFARATPVGASDTGLAPRYTAIEAAARRLALAGLAPTPIEEAFARVVAMASAGQSSAAAAELARLAADWAKAGQWAAAREAYLRSLGFADSPAAWIAELDLFVTELESHGQWIEAANTLVELRKAQEQAADWAGVELSFLRTAQAQRGAGMTPDPIPVDFLLDRGRYEDALAAERARGDEANDTTVSFIKLHLGRYSEALPELEAQAAIQLGPRTKFGSDFVRLTLALAYDLTGQHERALALCDVDSRLGSERYYLGYIHSDLGRHADALRFYESALEDADPQSEALVRANMIRSQLALGKLDAALAGFERARAVAEASGFRLAEAMALLYGGEALVEHGDFDRARGVLGEALSLSQDMGLREGEWRAWRGLSRSAAALGKRDIAIFFGKQAVNTIQSLREAASGLDRLAQRALLFDKSVVYRELAALLLQAHRLAEAEQVLDLLKQREHFEFVNEEGGGEALVFARAEQPAAGRFTSLRTELDRVLARESALRQQPASVERDAAAIAVLLARRKLMRDSVEALVTLTLETGAPTFSAADRKRLDGTARRLRRLGRVAALHYLVADDTVELLVTLHSKRKRFVLPIGSHTLAGEVAALRRALQNPEADPREAARQLYEQLLAPAVGSLDEAGIVELLLSLDGSLRYLPFAALHDGEQWLVERYATSLFSPVVTVARRPGGAWRVAAFGVSRAAEGFPALTSVPRELDGIVIEGAADSLGILPGRVWLDDGFTAEALRTGLASGSRVVHVASHFAFVPGDDRDSFLLTGDGRLSLADLRTGDYRFDGVELLVLSACETALESPDAFGREVEGLGTLARNQGASSVIATLWPVADESTGIFMQGLYAQRSNDDRGTAHALRQSQLAFLNGTPAGAMQDGARRGAARSVDLREPAAERWTVDPRRPFAHPFYWAPFILMGEGGTNAR